MPNEELKVDALDYDTGGFGDEVETESISTGVDPLPAGQMDSFSESENVLNIPDNQLFSVSPVISYLATDIIKPEATIMNVAGSGGAVTMSSNPQIADGINGQVLILKGTDDTNTLTLVESKGIQLRGEAMLGAEDAIVLYYDGTDTNDWIEVARSALNAPMGEISYFNTTGTSIAIANTSDGSTNMVVVNPTTTLNSESMEFDNGGSNNGRLRYTGAKTKFFHIACTISFAPDAANDTFVFGVAKSGTVIAASKVLNKVAVGSDTQSTAMHVYTSMTNNQYLELYVGNTTDADDLVIKSINLFAMGMD